MFEMLDLPDNNNNNNEPPQYIFYFYLLQLEFCCRLKITAGIDDSDSIEILIGRMHMDMKEKFQHDLSKEMEKLKELEREKHIKGKHFQIQNNTYL